MKIINWTILCLLLTSKVSAQVQVLEPMAFKSKINLEPYPFLMDIRKTSLYNKYKIKKAVNYPEFQTQDLDKWKETFLNASAVFIYCQNGLDSDNLAHYISDSVKIPIYVLDGGFENWTRQSMPYVYSGNKKENLATYSILDFNALGSSSEVVIIDFHASWCKPCKEQNTILESLKNEFPEIKIVKLDADINQGLCKNLDITEIPTLFLFKNKNQVWRHTGLVKKSEIKSKL